MTTYFTNKVQCSACGTECEQTLLGSTNSFGSPDLDLRPPPMQRTTMNAWLQQCRSCGYVAPDLSDAVPDRAMLASAEYQSVLRDVALPPLTRRFLAYGLLVRGTSAQQSAFACLRAAWVCDDAGETERAAACRGQAITQFERCITHEDNEQSHTVAAIYIDVLRRAGRFAEAGKVCETVLAFPGLTDILRQVIRYQQDLCARGDLDRHTVADAVPGNR